MEYLIIYKWRRSGEPWRDGYAACDNIADWLLMAESEREDYVLINAIPMAPDDIGRIEDEVSLF